MRLRLTAILVAVALLGPACGADAGQEPDVTGMAWNNPGPAAEPTDTIGSVGVEVGVDPESPGVAIPEVTSVVVGHVMAQAISAYQQPDDTAPVVAQLVNPTPIGGPLAFRLVDPEPPTGEWAQVYLPIRPNGTTGWVRTAELSLSANPYRIEVERASHTLRVFHRGEKWLETDVAIGTGSTPTPVGDFYIIELLQPPNPDGLYGPFAFGLSGFSETLTSFAGGDGVIGIHGTNEPSAIGSNVSHGCIRVANDVISTLAGVIPLGTPVTIT